MPTTNDRASRIRAAAQKVAQSNQTPKSDTRGTIGEFLRSRNESLEQDTGLFNVGSELVDSLKKRRQDLKGVYDRQSGPDQLGFLETGIQSAGALAGGVSDIAGAVLKGSYRLLAPKPVEDAIHNVGQDILNSDIGQAGMEALQGGLEYWQKFAASHPDAAKDLESVVDIASFIPNVKAATAAAKTVGTVGKTLGKVGVGTVRAAVKAPGAIKEIAKDGFTAAKDAAAGLRRGLSAPAVNAADDALAATAAKATEQAAAGSLVDDAARAAIPETAGPLPAPATPIVPSAPAPVMPPAPAASTAESLGETTGRFLRGKGEDIGSTLVGAKERIAPNIAKEASERAAVKALNPQGQKAVRSGLLRRDVEAFNGANDKEKGILREMVDAAEQNSKNRGTTHPSDLVGKEMNRRISLLDDERKVVGKKLGEQVKDLKTKEIGGIEKVQERVLKRLDEVPGLEGIKTTTDDAGRTLLDFSDTAMSGSQTEAARKELQAIWDDMTERSPFQLHRQRQELFEALGGKKAAKLALTETQEQGMEAFREGIGDALETVSNGYKDLNREYRQIITPLREMRKFYKGTEGAAEDVLDAKAGLLARRLTSNVASAPELRRILDEIGAQLAKRGQDVSDIDLNKLQDFYNALNRYYDITKDTTFEGLIKSGVNATDLSKSGMLQRGVDAVFKNTYVTRDTQQAALKELLGLTQE